MAGERIIIRGEVKAYEDLTLAGRVEGTIDVPNHVLTIGEHAQVIAEITAKSVVVAGNVQGNVSATDQVVLDDCGSLDGDIAARRVVIVEGARFDGRIEMPARVAVTASAA
jgi:cytoskeletal protein CcmA (bactofilin family)